MRRFDCCFYVRVVVLFFTVTTVRRAIASTDEETEIFSFKRVENKEDTIYITDIDEDETAAELFSKLSSSSSSGSSTSSWSKLRYSLFTNQGEYKAQLKQTRQCDIKDGQIYKENQPIPSFKTRCGSVEDFPCICAPDENPPILCNYCGFHSSFSNGNQERLQMSNLENFFCLKDGETSDPFLGRGKGAKMQRCSCHMEGNTPVSTCHSVSSSTIRERPSLNPPPMMSEKAGSEKNIIQDKKGPPTNKSLKDSQSSVIEKHGSEATKNGNKNTSMDSDPKNDSMNENRLEVNEVTEIEAKDAEPTVDTMSEDESVESIDDADLPDEMDEAESFESIDDADLSDEMDEAESFESIDDADLPDDMNEAENFDSIDDAEIPSSRNNPIDSADKNLGSDGAKNMQEEAMESNVTGDGFCTIALPSGELKTFQRGESYGEFVESECSQPSRFPCKCNPDLYNQMECPHCSFQSGNGDIVCAAHNQTVSFLVPDSKKSREVKTCTCIIPGDPSQPPTEACTVSSYNLVDPKEKDTDHYYAFDSEVDKSNSPENINSESSSTDDCIVYYPNTGEKIVVPIGESFADYVDMEGVCGRGSDWPAFCAADMVGTSTTDIASFPEKPETAMNSDAIWIHDREDVVYPYCVFSDTATGTPVCAQDTRQVEYTNQEGEEIQCSCRYNSIGSSSTCSKLEPMPDDTTATATMMRTRSSANKEPPVVAARSSPRYPTYSPIITPTQSPLATIQPSSGTVGKYKHGVFDVYGILKRTTICIALGHIFTAIL